MLKAWRSFGIKAPTGLLKRYDELYWSRHEVILTVHYFVHLNRASGPDPFFLYGEVHQPLDHLNMWSKESTAMILKPLANAIAATYPENEDHIYLLL